MSEQERTRDSAAIGLVLMAGLAAAASAVLVVAVAHGAPPWLFDAFLAVALVLVAAYAAAVLGPQRRLRRTCEALRRDRDTLRRSLLATLERIRLGNLADGDDDTLLPEEVRGALAAAVQSLSARIEQIQDSSTKTAAASEVVHQTAADLASGSAEQAAAVVEITATMEELARTAAQIARNAAGQAELAAKAEESGTAGAAAVDEALAGVEAVQHRIEDIASRADALGNRAKEIFRILDLITEIAHETHILSLNAGIEATTGGESGKRFAVVADEVRRLAQRSRESVDSVRAILDDFAASIRAAVVATEEADKEAAHVLERSRHAATAIAALRGALSDTARAAREISLATEEQRTASDQVVLTLREVSQVIHKMAESLKSFRGAAERVDTLALSIQLLTQSFHLDSPRSLKRLVEGWARTLSAHTGHWESVEGWLAAAVREAPSVELAYLADRHGTMLAFALGTGMGTDREVPAAVKVGASFADRPWFQSAMREKSAILTPLYESMLTGAPCFTVATPVRDPRGEVAAVLGLDVNLRSWTKI